jgi:hypothetical protein
MKKGMLLYCLLVVCMLLILGCASYYKIVDPVSKKVYYTDSLSSKSSGVIQFHDKISGSEVTLTQSEVLEITKDQYQAGHGNQAPAALPELQKSAEPDEPSGKIEPLGAAWQNSIVPKHRAIITFMDPDRKMNTFRGQKSDLKLSDQSISLSDTFSQNVMTTTPADLGVTGGVSRVFSFAQASGTVPQSYTLERKFMGQTDFSNVPTGLLCTSYLTKEDEDGAKTHLLMELTGRKDKTSDVGRLGRIKLSKDPAGNALPRPYYKYKFNADGSHIYAPALSVSVAHDMVAWDWDGDGYTDYMVSYVTNPSGEKDHKNMKVAVVFIDGKSLYEACLDNTKTVKFWFNTDNEYTTGGDVVGGLTDVKPANSVRMAIGDLDAPKDGKPEVALYYTKVTGPSGLPHQNALKILRLYNKNDKNTPDPYTDTTKAPKFAWLFSSDSDDCKNDDTCNKFYNNVGKWYVQYDSVAVAIGDLNYDGKDELVTIHGHTSALHQPSTIYLDVYNLKSIIVYSEDKKTSSIKYEVERPVEALEIGTTSKMADDKDSAPALEAAIADLDGDGTGELVWMGTVNKHPDQLQINIRAWSKYVFSDSTKNPLSGDFGKNYPYTLEDQVSGWTLDPNYIRYSMDIGRFVYPETDTSSVKLLKQIGLVTTARGSADEKLGLQWGIFKWNATDGLKTLGTGTKADSAWAINVVPSLIAADLDWDSMILGEGIDYTITDSTETLFNIQAPPRHWDVFTYNGTEYKMDAFSVLEDYQATLKLSADQTSITSNTTLSQGQAGVSFGYAKNKLNYNGCYTPPPTVAAGVDWSIDVSNETKNQTSYSRELDLQTQVIYDDLIAYRSNTHDLWRYPILFPESMATGKDKDGNVFQTYIQFIVPVEVSKLFQMDGADVDWYEPWHNNLNLFSYPTTLKKTRGYPQGEISKSDTDWWKKVNGATFAELPSQYIGSVNGSEMGFSLSTSDSTEKTKSVQNTVGGYLNGSKSWSSIHVPLLDPKYESDIEGELSGDYSYESVTMTQTDASKIMNIAVSMPSVADYKSPSKPYVGASEQKFLVDSSVYSTDSGTYSLAFAVPALEYQDSGIWGSKSPYKMAADPALNLPKMYTMDKMKWVLRTGSDSHLLRGLRFTDAAILESSGNYRGQAMPVNTEFTATLRVYNYSFVPANKVSVAIKFQPTEYDDDLPDYNSATPIGDAATIDIIPGRSKANAPDNWQDLKITWKTPTEPTSGFFHVVLSTEADSTKDDKGRAIRGGNLNTNNDYGYARVWIYNPADTLQYVRKGAQLAVSSAKSKSLQIVANSLSIRPAHAPEGGATSTLSRGQKAIVSADIRFDDAIGKKSSGILKVIVYLRDGKHIVGHRSVPLLLNGKKHTVRIPYTPPRNVNSVPLQLVVSSPYLPPEADSKPQGREVKTVLTIR